MPLTPDNGESKISKTQLFIDGKYLSTSTLPDARDTVDRAFDGLAEDLTWTVGVKRLFYTPPYSPSPDIASHIADIKDTLFTILEMTGGILMTNHLPRREMYLYYTASGRHDLEYADAGYMCFEVPITSSAEAATLIGVLSILARKDDTTRAIISAAEATKSYSRGTLKIKLMPRDVVEDNWEAVTDVLGDDMVGFFEGYHKS